MGHVPHDYVFFLLSTFVVCIPIHDNVGSVLCIREASNFQSTLTITAVGYDVCLCSTGTNSTKKSQKQKRRRRSEAKTQVEGRESGE